MINREWENFSKDTIIAIDLFPQLKEFFQFFISFFFLFPHLRKSTTKNQFLKLTTDLISSNNCWEYRWLKKILEFEIDPPTRDYLMQENWWWDILIPLANNDYFITSYELSFFIESLEFQEQRKTTGTFFSPQNQVKITCYYALFLYCAKNLGSMISKDDLYKMIFHKEFQNTINHEDYSKLLHCLKSIKIIDPSCGAGIFLAEMGELLISLTISNPLFTEISQSNRKKTVIEILSNLYGYDINPVSVKFARISLVKIWLQQENDGNYSEKELNFIYETILQIRKRDFLFIDSEITHKFDICIGNPPYVRHHTAFRNKSKKKTVIFQNLQNAFPNVKLKWDKKADLFIYFWMNAIAHIKTNGIVSFILSRAWFSSRYATPLNQILLSIFRLDLVLELPLEVWLSAEVRTHIVFGHKRKKSDKNDSTKFLVWKDSIEKLLQTKIANFYQFPFKKVFIAFKGKKLEIQAKETEFYRFSMVSKLSPLLLGTEELFPLLRMDYLTMSPFLLQDILIGKKDKFCCLKELGKIEMGSTTGINKFFYFEDSTIEKRRWKKSFLYPMTKSPREWLTPFSVSKKTQKYFLYIISKDSEQTPSEIREFLNSIQDEVFQRPYFQNKTLNNWYKIPLIQPELLLPNMIFKRSFVAYNQEKLHIDKQWIGFWANDKKWLYFLLAFLNSTLGILLREIQGTKTLGLGTLKLSRFECEELIVLDPRKVPQKIRKKLDSLVSKNEHLKIANIFEIAYSGELEIESEYVELLEAIDKLILVDYLGLPQSTISRIKQILQFELRWRFAKELRFSSTKVI
ncbi:MAG: Eco57I restriction-modification methylase domain-containing protein [Candidatus Hodarchaeales archaeon]|jgi:hypothetical protein